MTFKATGIINIYEYELSYKSGEQMSSRIFVTCEAALIYAAL